MKHTVTKEIRRRAGLMGRDWEMLTQEQRDAVEEAVSASGRISQWALDLIDAWRPSPGLAADLKAEAEAAKQDRAAKANETDRRRRVVRDWFAARGHAVPPMKRPVYEGLLAHIERAAPLPKPIARYMGSK